MVSSVLTSRSRTPLTEVSPSTSSTTAFVTNSILSFARARSSMICEARNSSRRWTTVTLSANFVRKIASSIAESPPPTTTMFFSRKKAASQTAQYDTPRAWSLSSESRPSFLASAPVETMTASERYSSSPT